MGNETFAAERDRLRQALAGLGSVASERESAAADSARALDAKLAENRFNVVVFGEFKRGKTTFVNVLGTHIRLGRWPAALSRWLGAGQTAPRARVPPVSPLMRAAPSARPGGPG